MNQRTTGVVLHRSKIIRPGYRYALPRHREDVVYYGVERCRRRSWRVFIVFGCGVKSDLTHATSLCEARDAIAKHDG